MQLTLDVPDKLIEHLTTEGTYLGLTLERYAVHLLISRPIIVKPFEVKVGSERRVEVKGHPTPAPPPASGGGQ